VNPNQRTGVRTQSIAYLLAFFTLFAQVDDDLALAVGLPSLAVAGDDDGLAVEREQDGEPSSCRALCPDTALKPATDNLPCAGPRRVARPGSNRVAPVQPSPLYLFMSLQR
jgi:hypothetical protein